MHLTSPHTLSLTFQPKYSLAMRALHWLVFLGAVVAVAAVEFRDVFPKGSTERAAMMAIHESAGITILVLMLLRLLVRVSQPVPPPPAGDPRWMDRAASAMHVVLYVLMLAMPVLGMLAVAWKGKTIPVYGLQLALPLAINEPYSKLAKEIHETGATFVYIFVGLHAAAALWHQFVLKDRLLRRMI
ncbi:MULTISPECIES: cytochrome b [Cupriavidus]|nr:MULTISPECIES: cytochrome b [Cupriavidus]